MPTIRHRSPIRLPLPLLSLPPHCSTHQTRLLPHPHLLRLSFSNTNYTEQDWTALFLSILIEVGNSTRLWECLRELWREGRIGRREVILRNRLWGTLLLALRSVRFNWLGWYSNFMLMEGLFDRIRWLCLDIQEIRNSWVENLFSKSLQVCSLLHHLFFSSFKPTR